MRISEIFYSVQGEGSLVGMPSVFIRTAGCNLRCDWCDTKYAWKPEAGQEMSISEVMAEIGQYSAGHAVLTGGEPMIAPGIRDLAESIADKDLHITIETNLTARPDDVKCHLASLSPKLDGEGELSIEEQIDIAEEWLVSYDCQFKFVIRDGLQIAAIEEFLERIPVAVAIERIFLMPEAANEQQLVKRSGMVADLCTRYGFRYGQRLHLRLFGVDAEG